MSKQANSAQTKKLQAELSKLKIKLATTGKQLQVATKTLKDQKNNFKAELATKVNAAINDACSQAYIAAEKKLTQRDKVISAAVDKFEKEWAKKYGLSSTSSKSSATKVAKKKTGKKQVKKAVKIQTEAVEQ